MNCADNAQRRSGKRNPATAPLSPTSEAVGAQRAGEWLPDARRQLTVAILQRLNAADEHADVMGDILTLVRDFTGFTSVAIRLRDGDEFPYYVTDGFPRGFVERENALCEPPSLGAPVRGASETPALACLCGRVLSRNPGEVRSCFTENGSFWTNNAADLATVAGLFTRSSCLDAGFQSIALIPLSAQRQVVGLLQLADTRANRLDRDGVAFLEGIGPAIGIALTRKHAQAALRESEERYRAMFDRIPAGVIVYRPERGGKEFVIADLNRAAEQMDHLEKAKVVGRKVLEVLPGLERSGLLGVFRRVLTTGQPESHPESFYQDDRISGWRGAMVYRLPSGELVCVCTDETQRRQAENEKRKLEVQLRQGQKLESLGVLAGGMAHDFNNLLMGILGNADLAMESLPVFSEARTNIQDIGTTAKRAAELCRQMLAYSGQGQFQIRPTDLNELVREMARLLEFSIRKGVVLCYDLADNLPAVSADATQVRQVVMNLITNASDAIGSRSGRVQLSTGITKCDREFLRRTYLQEDLPPGQYVYLQVADNGCGMDEETRERLFDPFFTTKTKGRGLGLSAVLGIIRGHRGAIEIWSEPGKGSMFRVLLPALDGAVSATEEVRTPDVTGWRGSGTVLLADDEETVRVVGERMLQKLGFTVVTAVDGRAAIEQFAARAAEIRCVILDLTMPHVDGREALEAILKVSPDVPVIVASGYSEEALSEAETRRVAGFLRKPYHFADLAAAVRDALSR
ncbi:MAG: hypothetical protein A3K19_33565 [Lentisphaerae bacterium RIFOXYB12_FULL_65_16]|nr:MAG: hypothetical protein A3K18_26295 [Lentisphaerae bacterium RIFOXYA12_64_32]OGV88373.1 MAG: hypothetical protein A3K19_33565 [Lentisphaerae bacterium RIFOXYB12_FULL_65_16]